jgi:gluconate transporter
MPLLIVCLGIALLLFLMIYVKLNSFISLILVCLAVGLAQSMSPAAIIISIQKGVGGTLGDLTLILGFGAMLGSIIAKSGAAQQITNSLVRKFGIKHIHSAIVITGFLVGIPMFYTVGFVMMVPLIFTVALQTGLPLLYVGVPMVAALSVTHGFLPPHPGPTAIASFYNADIGLTLLYGIVIAIPAILAAGPLFARFLKNKHTPLPKGMFDLKPLPEEALPPLGQSIIIALMPVFLIMAAALADLIFHNKALLIYKFVVSIGEPVIAMLVSVLAAVYFLGIRRGEAMKDVMDQLAESIKSIAMIMLIIGGGSAFKQVLIDGGVGNYITDLMSGSQISPLILAWCIAAALRISLGSATVAGLTAAGIVAPLVEATGANPELMVLSTGAGSLLLSNVNDAGFWLFKEYFNLSVGQTFATWSVMETIVGVAGLLGVLALDMIL